MTYSTSFCHQDEMLSSWLYG